MPRFRTTSVLLSALALASVALLTGPVAATAANGPPAYYPSGPQLGVDQSALEGWTLCYTDTYADWGAPLYGAGGILSELCTGEYLLLAGGPTGDTTLTLLAAAPRADVLFDTGYADYATTHVANGTGWYFSDSWSWGFALPADPVSKNSCDTEDVNADFRLCWHTYSDGGENPPEMPEGGLEGDVEAEAPAVSELPESLVEAPAEAEAFDVGVAALAADAVLDAGYRAGSVITFDEDYTRYIYQSSGVAAAALPATGAESSTPLLLAGGLVVLGLAIVTVATHRRRVSE